MWHYQSELYHWGIKGMKWGVRRFQNKDGSLTLAGRRRYADDEASKKAVTTAKENLTKSKKELNKAYSEYQRKTAYGMVYDKKALDDYTKVAQKKQYAKEDYADAKLKMKIPSKKSKRQLSFEEEYKKKGYSAEEAELTAYKRVRAERAIAAVVAGAVVAGAAYAGYRYWDRNFDKNIKAGTILQNISTNGNKGVEDAFYAAYHSTDKIKYKGMYGGEQLGAANGSDVYAMMAKIKNGGLKVASVKSANKVFSDLMNSDSDFRKSVEDSIKDHNDTGFIMGKQKGVFEKAVKAISEGKVNSDVYNAMNFLRVGHDSRNQEISNKFYAALKKSGYDAIQDLNDKYWSGYKSIQPIIIFNGTNLDVESNTKIGRSEARDALNKAYAMLLGSDAAKQVAYTGAAIVAAMSGNTILRTKKDSEIVADYKREHPGTKLSAKEIVRNYKGGV